MMRTSLHPNAGPKRLGHRKSRNGCARCKQRRVKCDEKVPCTACISHRSPCSLERPGQGIRTSPAAGQLNVEARYPQSFRIVSFLTREQTTLPGPSHSSCTSSPRPSQGPAPLTFLTETPECWVSNAELIVHYTTVAYRTLVFTDSMVQFLQVDLPRQAVSHTFLLQQLMAFAGLHLAHTTPGSRELYLLKASRQQDRAIKGLRAGLSGPVNTQNCHTLYVASIFLILCKFALFAADEPRHRLHACVSPTGGLLEIFTTISGMSGVFRPLEEHIRHGPFAGMFQRGPGVYSAEMVNLQNRLGELRARIEADVLPIEEGNTLLQAIDSLVAATVRCSSLSDTSRPTGLRATFIWPMLVERRFVDMAEADHPASLVIIAHYCVLLSWSGRMLWCFERWAGSVIGEISDKIGGTSWAGWMEWPQQVVASDSGENTM